MKGTNTMKNINLRKLAAAQSGTNTRDWFDTNGPDSGVGVDYWLRNDKDGLTAYVNLDQGEYSVSITADEDNGG